MAARLLQFPRELHKRWNGGLIAGSIAVALLGAFTSTQLICQARASPTLAGTFVWTLLGSLTFGFCSIWSFHQVAMLACDLDLPIHLNARLTVLSAIIAVAFTFAALGSGLLRDKARERGDIMRGRLKRASLQSSTGSRPATENHIARSEDSLLAHGLDNETAMPDNVTPRRNLPGRVTPKDSVEAFCSPQVHPASSGDAIAPPSPPRVDPILALSLNKSSRGTSSPESIELDDAHYFDIERQEDENSTTVRSDTGSRFSVGEDNSHSTDPTEFSLSTLGVEDVLNMKLHQQRSNQPRSVFLMAARVLHTGFTSGNILKGFFWSLAITTMHYVGISALEIPDGFYSLDPVLVTLSALISWIVCTVGCICMTQMETHLTQQVLFSMIAVAGVSAMHFIGIWHQFCKGPKHVCSLMREIGMNAASLWSYAPPSTSSGYPPELAFSVAIIAMTTCLAVNGLLAHTAAVSRNKLVENVETRRKLWMTIVQKRHAEAAAAARVDFIASASHEIRTPLHQLQGYSDLLAQTELSEEGRLLLSSMQQATKTLSLSQSCALMKCWETLTFLQSRIMFWIGQGSKRRAKPPRGRFCWTCAPSARPSSTCFRISTTTLTQSSWWLLVPPSRTASCLMRPIFTE